MPEWKGIDLLHPMEERPIRVTIRAADASLGEVTFDDVGLFGGDYDPGCFNTYLWEEGNYACDCNRSLMFWRAKGDPHGADDRRCGDEAFFLRITDPVTGAVLYEDD